MIIYPSLSAGDVLDLREQVRRLESLGLEGIHFDVMDGHFVEELTFGSFLLRKIRESTSLHLDVHLMVSNPDQVYKTYLEAGADTLSFHPETTFHPYKIVSEIKKSGKRASISLNPGTPWQSLECLLPLLDQVTILTVNPGYSYQTHLEALHHKIESLASYRDKHKLSFKIQVDGGVNPANIGLLKKRGCDNVVVGGSFFQKGKNEKNCLEELIKGLNFI
jgi:ribulose-phosphate 3-epimerase